jgi:hypothetical protein
MVERVREVTIAVYVDTNKNTYSEVFDDVEEGRDYLQGLCNDLFPDWSQKEIDKIKWVSVKERLPEVNKGFIGFAENQEVCNCYRYPNNTKDDSPVFYAQTNAGLLICGLESISHWQPLPEAPEEA